MSGACRRQGCCVPPWLDTGHGAIENAGGFSLAKERIMTRAEEKEIETRHGNHGRNAAVCGRLAKPSAQRARALPPDLFCLLVCTC